MIMWSFELRLPFCIMCVQYIGGCSVHWGMFSTSGGVQYIGGYHEHIGGCSVHRRDIMIHVGEQLDKILSISIEDSDVLNIPRCTHDIPPMYSWYPPMYSWYPPNVLMVYPRCTEHPRCTHDILRCTHGIPRCTEHPRCTHDILRCTHGIPQCTHGIPRCTEHSPMYWTAPDVVNTHYTGCLPAAAKLKSVTAARQRVKEKNVESLNDVTCRAALYLSESDITTSTYDMLRY